MNSVDRLNVIKVKIPENVKIVAVSKTKPVEIIELLYREAGQRCFGENKVQELELKHGILPADIEWHFIGHLQTNKIKYIAPYVALIQSVDSYKLIHAINKEGIKINRVIPCLIQFHVATEEAKYGFSIGEAIRMLDDESFSGLSNVSFNGVMGMATYTEDKQQIRKEFKQLFNYYTILKSTYFSSDSNFREISMGMTDDYELAIEEGSTMVRIGSAVFGER